MSESPGDLATALSAGAAAVKAGDFKGAALAFMAADKLSPNHPGILNNIAAAVGRTEGLAAALPWLLQVTALAPNDASARSSAGVTLAHLERFDEAAPHLAAALAINPRDARALEGVGLVAAARGNQAAARDHFAQALAIDPNRAEAMFRLGLDALENGDTATAIERFERAIARAPGDVRYLVKCGVALDMASRNAEARRRYDAALAIDPGNLLIWSNKLFSAVYDPTLSPRQLAEMHMQVDSLLPRSLRRDPAPRPTAGRRIRVGYVSADFRFHVGAPQLMALLKSHDRAAFEIVCYATNPRADAATEMFRALADTWRPIHDLSDDAAADVIERDAIDILVDLIGHSEGTRLGIFARRPAPVAVSVPGYVATTGLSAIDYRISDAVSDPDAADQANYSEQLVRLPEGHFCYEPLVPMPEVMPRDSSDDIVFTSFHNRRKYGEPVLDTWATLLKRVPRSRLLLKDRQFGFAPACDDLRRAFGARGVDPARLAFLGYAPALDAHYRSYHATDIALDPFPFNGTTTTLDALLMGVPVVALRGDRHVARLAANILTRVGLTDLIAESSEAYVEIAARLAADPARRADLRQGLRGKVETSAVIQARRIVGPLEDFYRSIV